MFTYSCSQCGKEFTRPQRIKSGVRPFCSIACSHDAAKVRKEIPCEFCGKMFYPRHKDRRFCSNDCYLASKKPVMVIKTCPVCGKTFETNASVAHRYTVCSRKCRTINTKYVPCERCGKVFRASQGSERHFCSEKCRRPPVSAVCETCGKKFRITPSNINKRRYCSFHCYRSSTARSSIEIAVHDALSRLGIPFQDEVQIGRYCADFCLPDHKIIIEADGDYWHSRTSEKDARRDKDLAALGWIVVRITEKEINNSTDLSMLISRKIDSIINI